MRYNSYPARIMVLALISAASLFAAVQSQASQSIDHVSVSGFEFTGNTVFSDADLESVSAKFVNKPLTRQSFEELRVLITRLYVDAGYLNSGAVIPKQEIEDGDRVNYEIREQSLSAITVKGAGRLSSHYIESAFRDSLHGPFNTAHLQQQFQLLLEDPLIEKIDGNLMPGITAGSSILNLKVKRSKPYALGLGLDNAGSPSIGTERLTTNASIRNLSGLGDALYLDSAFSEGGQNFNASWIVPVKADPDTLISAEYALTNSEITEEPLASLAIESNSQTARFGIEKRILHTLDHSRSFRLGFDFYRGENSLSGLDFSFTDGEENGKISLSVLRLSFSDLRRRADSVLSNKVVLSTGVDLFKPTKKTGNAADNQFSTIRLQSVYSRSIFDTGTSLRLLGNAQWSNDSLPGSERLALGGRDTLPGYRQNRVVRDKSLLVNLELTYPLPFFATGNSRAPIVSRPFISAAWGTNNDDSSVSDSRSESLLSAGIGLSWNFNKRMAAEFVYGKSISDINTRSPESNTLQEQGLHFSISARIL